MIEAKSQEYFTGWARRGGNALLGRSPSGISSKGPAIFQAPEGPRKSDGVGRVRKQFACGSFRPVSTQSDLPLSPCALSLFGAQDIIGRDVKSLNHVLIWGRGLIAPRPIVVKAYYYSNRAAN